MLTDAILVGASAAQELASFRISEHTNDEEIRRIDGSVHHHVFIQTYLSIIIIKCTNKPSQKSRVKQYIF